MVRIIPLQVIADEHHDTGAISTEPDPIYDVRLFYCHGTSFADPLRSADDDPKLRAEFGLQVFAEAQTG